jgi:hypothetical protein
MGLGVWILLINDDDSIRRLPLTKFERLMKRGSGERLPEYAGKRVRYAEVVVDLEQRKPVEILRMECFLMTFDSKGRIDRAERDRESRLAMDGLPPYDVAQENGNVVDARHVFAKRRYDNRYRWTPRPDMERAIIKMVFG